MTTTTHLYAIINSLRQANSTAPIEFHTLYKRKSSGPLSEQEHKQLEEIKLLLGEANTELEKLWKHAKQL